MLLAVDVGNTQTALGLYRDGELTDDWRLATERSTTADELGVLLAGLLDLDSVDGICVASTVPVLVREWELLASKWAHAPLLVVGPGVKTGIPIRYDDPREVGPDRIVNAVAAKERYGAPVIVVDFGTSTNFDVVSPEGEYVGGVIAPGIEISMEALFARAARLVKVDYSAPPAVIGKTTVGGLQSGLVYGFAGQVDGIVGRIRDELAAEARAIATGGLADLVAPHSRTIERVDPFLTLDGLRMVWELNAVIPDAHSLALFVVAALALLLVPGPAVLYVVARSIHEGRRAGIASVLGIHVGTLVHIAAATLGLSALIVSSAVAFTAVKIAGALYLVGLGLWTLFSRRAEPEIALGGERNLRRAFAQGVVVNVLNPKTALFFLAFLPQFVDADAGHPALQIAFLGLLVRAARPRHRLAVGARSRDGGRPASQFAPVRDGPSAM